MKTDFNFTVVSLPAYPASVKLSFSQSALGGTQAAEREPQHDLIPCGPFFC